MADFEYDAMDDIFSDSDEKLPKGMPPEWALTTSAVLALLFSVLGFLGNLLTIIALPFTKKLRNAATWFVINLAVTEMCFCITVLPVSAAHLLHLSVTGEKLFNDKGCRIFVFARYVVVQTELLSIAAIALNRCILIAIPKKYPTIFSTPKTICIIVGIWATSAIIMLLPMIEVYGAFNYNKFTQECDFDPKSNEARKVFLSIGFIIPCLIIIISYSYIFYKSRKSGRRIQIRNANALSSTESVRPVAGLRNRELRIARTIAVIFMVFIMCCTPVTLAHYYGSQGQIPLLLLLLHPLYWLQYCLNIFIYVFMNKQYRDAYISFISHWWPRFKTITQTCYQPSDDDTSASLPVASRHGTGKAPLKLMIPKKGSTSSPLSTPRVATPTAQKKFQCWDPKIPKTPKTYDISKITQHNLMESNQ